MDATPEASDRRRGWVFGGAIAAVLLLAAGGWYFLTSSAPGVSGPDEAVLSSGLTTELPPYITLSSLHAQASENIGNKAEPAFKTRFHATLGLTADTFVQSSVEDGAMILAPSNVKGATREVDGTAVSKLSAGNWKTEITLDNNPIPGFGQPRESFQGSNVIVQGSAEETTFRAEQRQRRDEAEREAQVQPEQEPAQQRLDGTGSEADRLKLEADAAARRRAEATRAAEAQKASEAEAQQRREEAVREAERSKAEAEVQRRREEIAAETERRRQADELAAQAVEIPAGTELNVRLSTKLNSGSVHVEDRFEATTVEDLRIGGRTVVPAGSVMRGMVSSVQPATRTNRTAQMILAFDLLTVSGQAYPIRARVTQAIAGAGLKGEAVKIGAGAGIGGVIGGLLGGAKGAAAGILIGGGGSIAATEGKQVELPQGAVLRTRIDGPVQIHIK